MQRKRADAAASELWIAEQQARSPGEPFDAGTLAEILARPPTPPHRVEHLIPWEASTLLVAQRKTGKTTTVLNLCRALLLAEPFLGQLQTRPLGGDIALLNFEVSAAQLARWAADVGVPADRLYLVNLRGRRNPLTSGQDREQLAQQLRARGVETVVVDPFGRAYTGASQNDAGEVGAWLIQLDQFTRSEVGAQDLILTAHAGWNGERTRGSTALEDWADSIITLTRDDGEDGEGQRYMRAIGRDVDLEEDQLTYDPETRLLSLAGAGSRKAARATRRIDDLGQAVMSVVQAEPGVNGNGIGNALRATGVSYQKGDERKATQRLVEAGSLRVEPGQRGAKRYFIATYPDIPRPTPAGQVLTYPDPTFRGGVGQEGTSEPDVPQTICGVCQHPMTLVEPGQTTHPSCVGAEQVDSR